MDAHMTPTQQIQILHRHTERAAHQWHTCATTHCRAGWAVTLHQLDDCALRAARVNLTSKLGPHLHHIVLTDYREQLVGIDAEIDRRLAESRLRPIDGRRTELPTEHQRDREFARAVARTL